VSILISRLSGTDQSIPKLKTGWEAWGKANYKSLKRAFDDKFKSMGVSDKGRAAAINKFKKERFLELSGEEQEEWTQKAIMTTRMRRQRRKIDRAFHCSYHCKTHRCTFPFNYLALRY